jgi:hypothetical protein
MGTLRIFSLVVFVAVAMAALDASAAGPATRLVRMMGSPRETIRLQAVESLRLDPALCASVNDDLIRIAQLEANRLTPQTVPRPSFSELLDLIAATDSADSQKFLISLLGSGNHEVVMAATHMLGKYQRTAAIDELRKQVDHPGFVNRYGFRFNLVRAFAQMGSDDAREFLVDLSKQTDGQLKYELDQLLAKPSLLEDRDEPAGMPKQVDDALKPKSDAEETIQLVAGDSESYSRERLKLQTSHHYYGIEIHAKRLMFIIDHSGSMKESEWGESRLVRAKRELVRVIEQLPEECEFTILFYADEVRQWRRMLVEATVENKRDAIEFVERLGLGDRTNTHAALVQSFEVDDNLEVVYLLTDGRPTAGKVVAPGEIIADVVLRNRYRNLQFNTIGIALEPSTEQFLRSLAELSGGEFRRVK